MAGKSNIEWTEQTWNPIVGCSIVSPGCTNCYAMKMASRIEAMGNQPRYAGTTKKVKGNAVWTGKLALAPESALLAPLRRKKPTTYFVNSMGDLFHEDCPDEWIDRVFAVMALSPQHTFHVLTKRAARMRDYFSGCDGVRSVFVGDDWTTAWHRRDGVRKAMQDVARSTERFDLLGNVRALPLPNVWIGVSTERQQEADERIPLLLQTPAAVRFISAEPLLGPINLRSMNHRGVVGGHSALHDRGLGKLDWVIVGGESGPGARPMHPAWARSLRDQCLAAGVPFFFKQWGSWVTEDQSPEDIVLPGRSNGPWAKRDCDGGWNEGDQTQVFKVPKKAAGRLLDGIEHNGMPG